LSDEIITFLEGGAADKGPSSEFTVAWFEEAFGFRLLKT
jgi:hypothetical protein